MEPASKGGGRHYGVTCEDFRSIAEGFIGSENNGAKWEQDGASPDFPKNPRFNETNISDLQGNRKRTTVDYDTVSKLPMDVREYAADAVTERQRTNTDYVMVTVYSDRHIIGLPSVVTVYDGGNTVFSKMGYLYDGGGETFARTSAVPSQHDEGQVRATAFQCRGPLWEPHRSVGYEQRAQPYLA